MHDVLLGDGETASDPGTAPVTAAKQAAAPTAEAAEGPAAAAASRTRRGTVTASQLADAVAAAAAGLAAPSPAADQQAAAPVTRTASASAATRARSAEEPSRCHVLSDHVSPSDQSAMIPAGAAPCASRRLAMSRLATHENDHSGLDPSHFRLKFRAAGSRSDLAVWPQLLKC